MPSFPHTVVNLAEVDEFSGSILGEGGGADVIPDEISAAKLDNGNGPVPHVSCKLFIVAVRSAGWVPGPIFSGSYGLPGAPRKMR